MSFNSLEFLIFVLVFFAVFSHARKNVTWQNITISLFSFLFYAFGDLKHLPLLFAVALLNYFIGSLIFKNASKVLLGGGIVLNTAFLLWGKIKFGQDGHLPLGISFYTFQAMCFLIDMKQKRATPPQSFWHFQAYLFFFPQLIAGPICRTSELMEQIRKKIPLPDKDMIRSGMYLLTWGLLKKAVIADALAIRMDESFGKFSTIQDPLAWSVIIFSFGWQIYFDFSGYSDMARGMGKLLGVSLPLNFSFPYFSRSPKDFWERWHITLSQWFRDYVYIPLGGSRAGMKIMLMAIFISFSLSALWHGIGFNYLLWGLWHASWLLVFRIFWKEMNTPLSSFFTLFIVFFGWFFFRARDEGQLPHILGSISNLDKSSFITIWYSYQPVIILCLIAILCELGASWFRKNYRNMKPYMADSVWTVVILVALIFQSPLKEFIYFRF